MIPYDRNPFFVGRDNILIGLRLKLQESKPQWHYNHRVAIFEMGGVGKTQIAIEYVYRHENDYADIYWIPASAQEALLSGFQVIGEKTGCLSPGTDRSKPIKVAKVVYGWLRRQENWLLVIDNLDDVSVVDGLLPAIDTSGHTLITKRNPDATNIPVEGLEIPILGENDSIELLLRRSDIRETDFPSYTDEAVHISPHEAVGILNTIVLFLLFDGKLADSERLCKRCCEVSVVELRGPHAVPGDRAR
jgi:hypothetical protein